MRRWVLLIGSISVGVLILSGMTPVGSEEDPDPHRSLDRIIAEMRGARTPTSPIVLDNFELVGHLALGDPRDFADVWGHESFAYVGTRCGGDLSGGHDVKVVDISDPEHPVLASTLSTPASTRAEDVVVRTVDTAAFTGDVAAVGIQDCFGSGEEHRAFTGMIFYDVTDGYAPVELGRYELPNGSFGCHEIDLAMRPDGVVLAGCAHNLVDQLNPGPRGVDFVDASDPTAPHTASKWSLGVEAEHGVGCFPIQFAHSVRFTNRGLEANVSNWDAGLITLDVSNPNTPLFERRIDVAPPDEDGDVHSMTPANGGQWIVINPEDFCVGGDFNGWGEAFVYGSRGEFLTTFSTPNSDSSRLDGIYTIHNTEEVLGDQFFSSWYSDGIVWWEYSGAVARQKGQFVPPSGPVGRPLVWGVYPHRGEDVILASDFGSGLWIVRPEGLGDF
jgi:hypothetical protein